ncbi:hypothetical protein D3C77_281760 [compost metagenome]
MSKGALYAPSLDGFFIAPPQPAGHMWLADDQSLDVFKSISRDLVQVEGLRGCYICLKSLPRLVKLRRQGALVSCDAWYETIRLTDASGAVVAALPGLYWLTCERYAEHKRVVSRESVKPAQAAYDAAFDAHDGLRDARIAYRLAYTAYDQACNTRTHTDAQHKVASAAWRAAKDIVLSAEHDAAAFARAAFEEALR